MHMKRLTLSQKISRLRTRMSDREWRRYGGLLLIGKLTGVALLIAGVALLPGSGRAAPNGVAAPTRFIPVATCDSTRPARCWIQASPPDRRNRKP